MSIPNLPVNFKDDILASSNTKRKYRQTANDDSTVSFEDVTNYSQEGSRFGAKEVNQTNTAINNIYDERILDLDELELVTEPGFFVDAQAAKEAYDTLNSKMFMCEFRQFETVEGETWVATPSGVTKTLDQPVSSYRLIGFLCISEGTDGRTHRQIQWFPSVWLQQIANDSNAANKTIIFNLSRGNSDRRVFIELVQNNPNKYKWLKLSNDSDKYSLVVFGLK